MPVEDKPVHPKTVDSGRWGCHNRPDFRPWYHGKERILVFPVIGKLISLIGVYKVFRIPYVNSMECQHGKAGGDPKCQDCFRRKQPKDSQ